MYLMLDVGGTEIKAGVLDEHGAIQAESAIFLPMRRRIKRRSWIIFP